MNRWMAKVMALALVCLIIAIVVAALGFMPDQPHRVFAVAYLGVTLIALQITVGAIFLLLLHGLTGGDWGQDLIETLKRISVRMPIAAFLFVFVLFQMHWIYPWFTHPEILIGESKRLWLQPWFFCIRTAFYLAVWMILGRMVRITDRENEMARSGVGLIILLWTVTMASFDWVLSLDPNWHSSIFGLIFLAGAFSGALAAAIFVSVRSARVSGRSVPLLPGKLLFTSVAVWAYVTVCQVIVIWMGHIPERMEWLLRRVDGPWFWVTGVLWTGQFIVPFLVLLFRSMKRNPLILTGMALAILFSRWLETLLWVMPTASDRLLAIVASLLVVCGLMIAYLLAASLMRSGAISNEAEAP